MIGHAKLSKVMNPKHMYAITVLTYLRLSGVIGVKLIIKELSYIFVLNKDSKVQKSVWLQSLLFYDCIVFLRLCVKVVITTRILYHFICLLKFMYCQFPTNIMTQKMLVGPDYGLDY